MSARERKPKARLVNKDGRFYVETYVSKKIEAWNGMGDRQYDRVLDRVEIPKRELIGWAKFLLGGVE